MLKEVLQSVLHHTTPFIFRSSITIIKKLPQKASYRLPTSVSVDSNVKTNMEENNNSDAGRVSHLLDIYAETSNQTKLEGNLANAGKVVHVYHLIIEQNDVIVVVLVQMLLTGAGYKLYKHSCEASTHRKT